MIVFVCVLIVFACLSRIIFFGKFFNLINKDFEEMYDTKENYAGFNFESFNQAFYTMIVAVSTTNFPMALVKAYSQSRLSSLFFIVNSFVMNFIMLNLIMASFYFYYQNFYVMSLKKLKKKPSLCM